MWYDVKQNKNGRVCQSEVKYMDDKERIGEKREPGYVPRPWWQVAGAWVGLVLFIGAAALIYLVTLRLI